MVKYEICFNAKKSAQHKLTIIDIITRSKERRLVFQNNDKLIEYAVPF